MHTACHLTTRHKSHIFGQQFQKHLLSGSHSWPAYLRATSMNVAVLMGVDKPDWALAQSQPSPNWNFFVGLSIACRRSRHPTPHMRSTEGKGHNTMVICSSAHYLLHPLRGRCPPNCVLIFFGAKKAISGKKNMRLQWRGWGGGGRLADKFCDWDS